MSNKCVRPVLVSNHIGHGLFCPSYYGERPPLHQFPPVTARRMKGHLWTKSIVSSKRSEKVQGGLACSRFYSPPLCSHSGFVWEMGCEKDLSRRHFFVGVYSVSTASFLLTFSRIYRPDKNPTHRYHASNQTAVKKPESLLFTKTTKLAVGKQN